MPDAIETAGLTKHYGKTVGIDTLSLKVRQGEIFGFAGPNGAGKTTTIRLLLGLLRPDAGTARLLGAEVRRERDIFRRTGYLPCEPGLYNSLTAEAYFRHCTRLRGLPENRAVHDRLELLKARFPIDFSRKIKTYSRGMRQITALIQAFLHQPDLVLLDEPSTGLDPLMQQAFYALLKSERERGCAIFFSSHILGAVEAICDRIAFIREGRMLQTLETGRIHAAQEKKIRIEARDGNEAIWNFVHGLGDARNRERHENTITLDFNGDINDLLKGLARFNITDFTCSDPGIEDLFIGMYRKGGND